MAYFYDMYGGQVYHKPPGGVPKALFQAIDHDGRELSFDTRDAHQVRDTICFAEAAEAVVLFDGTPVDYSMPFFDKTRQVHLFNPVFWYDQTEMEESVESEGEDFYIQKITDVGLGYYALPSELLAYVVDKLTA